MKDRILKLLINGMRASEIAATVGCSPGYVSQLVNDEDFKKAVEAGRLEAATKNTEEEHLEARYSNFEHKLLNAAEDAMTGASLSEITRALETTHKRAALIHARKHPTPQTGINVNVQVVSLALPAHAAPISRPTITLNENQEIIAIGGKALAPMSSDGVKGLFAARAAQELEMQQAITIEAQNKILEEF